MSKNTRLGFLASHNGSSMRAIVESCVTGETSGTPTIVLSNNSSSGALAYAHASGFAGFHVSERTEGTPEAVDARIKKLLQDHRVELVVLSGYMRKIGGQTLTAFKGRVINIHPALLPSFGGQGMYGSHVHEAVIASGVKVSGATVHVVDENYDTGRILAQQAIDIDDKDTPESLADRIRPLETDLMVSVVRDICSGRLSL